MTQRLQAVFENGVLRPLEPHDFKEQQRVTVTVSDQDDDLVDVAFLRYLESQADESITLEQVRAALSKIPGSMAEDIRRERDDRF